MTDKYTNEHAPRIEDLFSTRRQFLNRFGMGFGALSLAGLMPELAGLTSNASAAATGGPLAPKKPHFEVKAKRVIHIFAQGAPSQIDTWDPKPMLEKYANEPLPGMGGVGLPSPFKFEKKGKSGVEVSEVFPMLGE
ncbi:MAG TPA: DUF1501 domain-containing protein, partial [Roseimicrobium sp.]|nr:DUF1501 domain-containing protein [Roseimicrobium sp.]